MMRLRRGNERPGVRFMALVRQDRRPGFTLVELMVCMALIMFMMAILSQAFVSATGVFRNLKAAGDMAEKLRATTTLLQRDLAADHFEGRKRLSDPHFWDNGPPQQGFFRIWQGSGGTSEGNDLDGIASYLSTDHMLAFTIKLRGNQMSDFLSAGSQGGGTVLGAINTFGPPEARYQANNTYNWQWVEVTWFLQPQTDPNTGVQDTTASDTATGKAGVNLYTLYRNQRLAVPDNSLVPTQSYPIPPNSTLQQSLADYQSFQGAFAEASSWANPLPSTIQTNGNLYFNNPIDLTAPIRRFGMTPPNYGNIPPPAAGLPLVLVMGNFPSSYSWPNGVGWTVIGPTGGLPSYPTLAQLGGSSGADIQLTNVVSFDVRLLVQGVSNSSNANDPFVTLWQSPFNALPANGGISNGNPKFYPALPAPRGVMVFDTWSSLSDNLQNCDYSQWNQSGKDTSIPLWNSTTQSGPLIQALQITIRIWDQKTNQTRQVTLVQAM